MSRQPSAISRHAPNRLEVILPTFGKGFGGFQKRFPESVSKRLSQHPQTRKVFETSEATRSVKLLKLTRIFLCVLCTSVVGVSPLFAQTASDNFARANCASNCGASVAMNGATVAVANDAVTVTVANSFVPGTVVYFSGLSANAWLNGQYAGISSASATQFSFNYYKSNQAATSETAGTVSAQGFGLGANWTQRAANIGIVSNKADDSGAQNTWYEALYVGAGAWSANQTASVSCLNAYTSADRCGVIVRGQFNETGTDAGHSVPWFSGYRYYMDGMAGVMVLSKMVNSTETVLKNNVAYPTTDPQTLSLSIVGTTLTAKHGSTTDYTVTDSSISAGLPGITLNNGYQLADPQANSFSASSTVSIALSPASLPNAPLNTAYSQTITAAGGTAPYTFSKSAGTLPTGLSLSSGGVLSGTPTAAGTYSFTVQAIDAASASGSQAYTVIVYSQFNAAAGETLAASDSASGKTPKVTRQSSDALLATQYADDFSAYGSGSPNGSGQYDTGLGGGYDAGTVIGGAWLNRPQSSAQNYKTDPYGACQSPTGVVAGKDVLYCAPQNCPPAVGSTQYMDWSMPLNVLWDSTRSIKGIGTAGASTMANSGSAAQAVYQGSYGADPYAQVTIPNDVMGDAGFQNLFLMLKWQQTVPAMCTSNYAYDYIAYYAGSEPCNYAACPKSELTGAGKWHITKVTPQVSSTDDSVVAVAIGTSYPVAGDTMRFETRHDSDSNQHLVLLIKPAGGAWRTEIDVIDNDMPTAIGQAGLFLGTHTPNKIYFENFSAGSLADYAMRWPDYGATGFSRANEFFAAADNASGAVTKPGLSLAETTTTVDALAGNVGHAVAIADATTTSASAARSLGAVRTLPANAYAWDYLAGIIGSAASPVGDSFTDSDGTPLTTHTSDTGQSWLCRDGGMAVASDMLLTTTAVAPYYASCYPNWTPASADYQVSADVEDSTSSSYLMARYTLGATHDSDSAYIGGWNASGYLELRKLVNGATVPLGTQVASVSQGDTISLAVRGTSVTLYLRGAAALQFTDGSLTQPGHAGVMGTNPNASVIDNFRVQALSAAPVAARRRVTSSD